MYVCVWVCVCVYLFGTGNITVVLLCEEQASDGAVGGELPCCPGVHKAPMRVPSGARNIWLLPVIQWEVIPCGD